MPAHREQQSDTSASASTAAVTPAVARRKASAGLWIVQIVLAALFLFAGGMKLVAPIAMLTRDVPLPGLFLRFIGVVEVTGALGLILPSLLRIRPQLTPLAAAGLVIVMSGATGVTMAIGQVAPAGIPFLIGALAGLIAYGRTRIVPIASRRNAARRAVPTRTGHVPALQPAR